MDNSGKNKSEVYSTKIRAGKRTYFFDIKETRSSDYYITITESKRRFGNEGYDKHKIFLYKEDFNKFMNCLNDTINHVKENLLPDYNYDEFDRENDSNGEYSMAAETDGQYGDGSDEVATTWDE